MLRLRFSPKATALTLMFVAMLISAFGPIQHPDAAIVTVCNQFDTVGINGRNYVVQNNIWNDVDGSQCIRVDNVTGAFTITSANHNVPPGPPAAYPSIFKGCQWGDCTVNSGMPVRVNTNPTVTSSWSTTLQPSGIYDAAYDIWYNTTPTTPGRPDGGELMIWLTRRGNTQPVGSVVASNVSIAGATWNVWFGNIGWNVISYVRTTATTSVSNLNLTAFTNDSVSRGFIQASSYLIAIEAGFEPWQGGTGLATNSFSATVSAGTGPIPTTPPGGGTISPTIWYSVVNRGSGKCVDARAASTANGTAVQQFTCNNTFAQQWQFQPTSSGFVRATNRNNAAQVWDVGGGPTVDNAIIQLWTYGGGNNQQWQAASLGGGFFRFVSRNGGKCLDVPGASTADSVQLVQFTCNSTNAQSFSLVPH